ncbi:hypothetical protein [Amycolatopsis sp. PS_44_ISF1]|uniref:hypothetical protein n=1 Tax=Amycolatopsis sp. PS_44_ISF1 TaxID=2974917 RepID=UPI0028E06AEC|nr:hypothetical protein [Amycolatopsis sp. PS_44_ISF1]MDT8910152.1 hypothetical protein [Amycolatopsis sp. PS_44_ISF1]
MSRFLLRVLAVVGGAFAATVAVWIVAGGTAGADTLLPPDLVKPSVLDTASVVDTATDAVLPVVAPVLPVAGLDRIEGTVHEVTQVRDLPRLQEVTQPVHGLLKAVGQSSRASRGLLGQVLTSRGGLKESGEELLGSVVGSKRRAPVPAPAVVPVAPPSAGEQSAVSAEPAVEPGRPGVENRTAAPKHPAFVDGPAVHGEVWSATDVGHATGKRPGPLPAPLPPSPNVGSTTALITGHGGNDGCGVILSNTAARRPVIGETRRTAARRAAVDTACQPGITPD